VVGSIKYTGWYEQGSPSSWKCCYCGLWPLWQHSD